MPTATLSTLVTAQAVAGARYAAAVTEFIAAYVDLAALDRAIGCRAVNPDGYAPTFIEWPQSLQAIAHPVYVPKPTATRLGDAIREQADVYIHSVTGR